jgi:hypothetical protein
LLLDAIARHTTRRLQRLGLRERAAHQASRIKAPVIAGTDHLIMAVLPS